ncbi:uncharacterized protein LAESUDRAFT_764940 [Laetiporus sulphureus 93-53]|uniref:ERCC4 domain-containing protein n=1 Tax=Laetiporus sulphureus 93-53 TaxID=1314785 RepID=A0A165B1T9_9APHY|nr:uncharacterized protein LAESUDRAFT_764940 [Laetiporus sulphureus 93-53]KZT00071.1 hypothetical protein LAESUDRAFT_764940 [Laetiporus sulphureus 93-53]
MAALLSFHKSILEKLHDPSTSELLLLARGLGLRRIVCKLLQIYDSPNNLVLLVNAFPEEESAIGEELGVMGCRKPGLRIIGFETVKKDRQDLYKKGGLVSLTSQIFTVDMLTSDIPTELITGIIMLHAEKVTPTSAEAFIVRLYREKNQTGFLKAFSDQPEQITSGMSPLRTILKELQIRTVHIYPRFHVEVKQSIDVKRPDLVELDQEMTEYMAEIHTAIVQCMSTTLSELKRANTSLDLDDLTIDNAYFRSFDMIVRRLLDPVWHKVGPRTKQLVSDLATLRRLLTYLLTYDTFSFQSYLDTLIASNTFTDSGAARQHQSPWMLTDAANNIFLYAKRRCYTVSKLTKKTSATPQVTSTMEEDEAWAVVDELDGQTGSSHARQQATKAGSEESARPYWLPEGIDPVLEELPKWTLLADALQEIEQEMINRQPVMTSLSPGTNTVLIMTSSLQECTLLNEFLSTMDADAPPGSRARKMMEERLHLYLWWRSNLSGRKQEGKALFAMSKSRKDRDDAENNVSEALKKKDQEKRERAANRRRVRGGMPSTTSTGRDVASTGQPGGPRGGEEAEQLAAFLSTQIDAPLPGRAEEDLTSLDFATDFDMHYGLLAPEQTVLVRAYSDDTDDRMLQEIQPRFIIMFEPNLEFIRRIEVYRNANAGLGVRVYFMMYRMSCEEGKYLTGLRREKESFERLIKERGSMLMPILEDRRQGSGESLLKTISSRIAGGRKELSTEPSRVIVDMREFRSSLPSLLHASHLLITPVTLTVGDYILTPDICVERKSIPDLVSSFNSGRLYTQCELMSAHYKQPILLIEFEEHKSFSLEAVADVKSYAKQTGKYPTKKKPGGPSENDTSLAASIQSKLVLLTLTFPRVRIIWSSSPYATAEIFRDLKANSPEPDPAKAVTVGAEEDPDAGAGVNAVAEELLRTLPGITAKNVKHVMSKVESVRALCELSLPQVQEILGVEPGKACWEFIHRGERRR